MSLKGIAGSSLTLSALYPSTCLLPFLYHTRTLLSPPLQVQSSKAAYTNRTVRRSFCLTARRRVEAYRTWRPNYNATEQNAWTIPSAGHQPPLEHDDYFAQAPSPRRSTVTAPEKAVFERIFKDISRSVPEADQEEDNLDDQSLEGNDPYEDLNSIFDAAIKELQVREERAQAAAAKDRPLPQRPRVIDKIINSQHEVYGMTFKRPLRLANGVVLGKNMDTEEDGEKLAKACTDHKGLLKGMLERATTDVEIWQVLEKEVFSLIAQLDKEIKVEEKARKDEEKARKGERKGGKEKKKGRPKKEVSKSKVPNAKALQVNTLVSILQSNYAHYTLSALRLLRRHHPTSFYSLHLLPTIKRLGPISYVLGASTALYNETIFLKWTQFSDLHGMADLMQEMINQGVESNEVTLVFLDGVKTKRSQGRQGQMGDVVKAWWNMRGTQEGWNRVQGLYGTFKQKAFQNKEIEAKEAVEDEVMLEEEGSEWGRVEVG
ncbi:hypothetical protein MMC28_000942 [Mycoblastus sanguinarius]|nr:hypothetical protein [Mycoblastus sanguinarius]